MKTPSVKSPFADLRRRLPGLMPRDRHRLRRRIDGAEKIRDPDRAALSPRRSAPTSTPAKPESNGAARLFRRSTTQQSCRSVRKKDEILAAIRDHQVVIVAGETGSGKTTQLPKICLELGRGVLGQIGHTQPRRLAARTVAARIAEELGTTLGEWVGYKVRFTDVSSDDTLVKLMTDGILLAEIQQDRMLRAYDTLIIDEAHERSLNIDFILGYLKRLLPRRPDLKVIITSATIDPERFSRHFDNAPIVEVSGRTYPVEVRYRPLTAEQVVDDEDTVAATDDRDQIQGICDAVDELCAEGPGDILVFLSGEREIRDTAEALGKHLARRYPEGSPQAVEILPLYARLSAAEQQRVFQPRGKRRIVLATNVAETSLTVPGIRYVVDPGTARISRYSHRTKVQRLPIERISQASANQRKGRCGRVAEGICIRLYSEEDFLSRPEFTEPEILRTNLASVILQMAALGLGDVEEFPFVDGPTGARSKTVSHSSPSSAPSSPRRTDGTASPRWGAPWPSCPSTAPGPHGGGSRPQRLPPRGHGDRCCAVHPRPPRTPGGTAAGRSPEARPFRRPRLGLPGLPEPVELPERAAAGTVRQPVPQNVPRRVPQLPAGAGVAGHLCAAPPDRAVLGDEGQHRPCRRQAHPPVPACRLLSHIGSKTRRNTSTWGRGAPGLRSFPARRCSRNSRAG